MKVRVAATILALALVAASHASALPPQQSSLSQANIRLDGEADNDAAGFSVAGAGDVNGDGLADVIVGARNTDFDARRVDAGAAYVIFGRASNATIDLLNLGTNGFRIEGADFDDHAGAAVAGARDVNGDGLADVIVGAFRNDALRRFNAGAAYVVFGKASNTPVNLAAIGTAGFRIDGAASEDFTGRSVSAARDVNGDGRADVIVGAPSADNNGRNSSGSAYVVFGKATTTPIDLAALGAGGFRVDGANAGEQAGFSVSAAGDIGADGRPDVIIGSPTADIGGADSGSVYAVFGKTTTTAVDLATFGGPTSGFRMHGAVAGDQAGYSVAGFIDANADGLQDIVVGAPIARSNAGSAYLVFGSRAPGTIQLGALGPRGYVMDGAKGDQAGFSSAAPGDVNRDGRPDVILGGRNADHVFEDSGAAYTVYGKKTTALINLAALGTWGYRLHGAAVGDQAGTSVGGAGDVNGDGRPDVIVGAPAADNNGRNASGTAYVVFN